MNKQRLKGTMIFGRRLEQARHARGLTVSDVAERVGVSRQMITRYESGDSMPQPEICFRLSQELRFPIEFFSKPLSIPDSVTPVFFRKSASLTQKTMDAVKTRIEWMYEIVEYLSEYIDLPQKDLPDFSAYECPEDGWDPKTIEELAIETRKQWGLGLGPISNVAALLEQHGIIIGRISGFGNHIDACSWLTRGYSWILLESNKTAVRERFDLAHELGHLILHPWLEPIMVLDRTTHKRIEDEANRFASSFLLPGQSFSMEVLVQNLAHLQILKSRWKVSIQAMIRRLVQLDLIDEATYKNLNTQVSIKGWKRMEPLDDQIQREEPSTLRDSIELLIENQLKTPDSILADLRLSQDEIETLCSLPVGRLNPQKPAGPSLRRMK